MEAEDKRFIVFLPQREVPETGIVSERRAGDVIWTTCSICLKASLGAASWGSCGCEGEKLVDLVPTYMAVHLDVSSQGQFRQPSFQEAQGQSTQAPLFIQIFSFSSVSPTGPGHVANITKI